jgi:IS5 family transposase
VAAPKGVQTSAHLTDCGKSGAKRHLVVEAKGIPLAVVQSDANVHNARMMLRSIDAIEPERHVRGRAGWRPATLHSDKAYDSRALRVKLRRRGIQPRMARRGIDTRGRQERYRWVVERARA